VNGPEGAAARKSLNSLSNLGGAKMKAFECTGFWCLPGEDNAVAGTLHVSGDGDLRLSLIGSLGRETQGFATKTHKIIHGSVDKSPQGNALTLTGCVLTSTNFGTYYGAREEYRASRCFFGAQIEKVEDFSFRRAILNLSGLSEWARALSGLHREPTTLPMPKDEGKSISVATYRVSKRPSGQIPGGTVTLIMGVSSKSEPNSVSFHEEANLLLELETPKTAEEINRQYVYPLQNLMTFVADRAQILERFSVWRGANLSDWEQNPEIQVVGPRVQPDGEEDERKTVRGDEMLFNYADVDFSTFLAKWLKLADSYSESFNIFFGIQYGPPRYIDMTFLLVVQSLMLYFTRTSEGATMLADEERLFKELLSIVPADYAAWLVDHLGPTPYPPLTAVLRRLVERHGAILDPLISGRRDAFVGQSANTLRYIEQRKELDNAAASHGSDLYWLMQKLRLLIKASYLSELGIPNDKISDLFQRNGDIQHIADLERSREAPQAVPQQEAGNEDAAR